MDDEQENARWQKAIIQGLLDEGLDYREIKRRIDWLNQLADDPVELARLHDAIKHKTN